MRVCTTRAVTVTSRRHPDADPGTGGTYPHAPHMSEGPATLVKRGCPAPFHRLYCFYERIKNNSDRGWAR